MRFNSLGEAATGFHVLGVDGAALPGVGADAGFPTGPSWLDDTTLFFQYCPGTGCTLGTYALPSGPVVEVSSAGANIGYAGGGVWAASLLGGGLTSVRTNVPGFGPLAGQAVLDVTEAGLVVTRGYASGGPVRVYSAAGVLLRTFPVTIVIPTIVAREDVIAYNDAAGWYLALISTGVGIAYAQRSGLNWVIPVDDGGTPWVVERTGDLWVREPGASVAYNLQGVASPPGTSFNPDALLISAGVIRVGYAVGPSEDPGDLIVIDLTLATGATSIGTVSGGTLTFAAGPTLTPEAITTGGTTTGGGSSGGPVAGGSSSNIVRTVTRPALPKSSPARTYPHVAQITDPHTQQSVRLLWDLHGRTLEKLATADRTMREQALTNRNLRRQIADVAEQSKQALAVAGKITAQSLPSAPGPTLPPGQVGGDPGPTPPPTVPPGTADEIDATSVTWVGLNVSAWPITAAITNVQITSSQICLDYTGKNSWPAVDPDGSGTLSPGNPWVFANIAGTWYASTYEWLRVGQICKNVTGPEFQDYVTGTSPLDTWAPALGEQVGFMVSALARNGPQSPVNQRTQIVLVSWPF